MQCFSVFAKRSNTKSRYCLPSREAQEVPCRSVFAMRWIQSAFVRSFVRSFVCVHCPPFRGAQRARSPVG